MKHDVAAGSEGACSALAEAAAERLHRQIVRDQEAVEADLRADHIGDHRR